MAAGAIRAAVVFGGVSESRGAVRLVPGVDCGDEVGDGEVEAGPKNRGRGRLKEEIVRSKSRNASGSGSVTSQR